jgi:hypothetical protein
MNKEDVLESMTWEEFLFHCDVQRVGLVRFRFSYHSR